MPLGDILAAWRFRQGAGQPKIWGTALFTAPIIVVMLFVAFASRPATVASLPGHDLASWVNGARIIDEFTSETRPAPFGLYYVPGTWYPYVEGVISEPAAIPEIALGIYSDDRALWYFTGTHGTLAFKLSSPSVVGTVRFHGYPSRVMRCLPGKAYVWGLIVHPDNERVNWSALQWPDTLPTKLIDHPSANISFAKARGDLSGSDSAADLYWIPLGSVEFSRMRHFFSHHDFVPHPAVTEARVPVHAMAIEFKGNLGNADATCFARLSVNAAAE